MDSDGKIAQRGYKSNLELYEHVLIQLNCCIPNGTYVGVEGQLDT